MTRILIVEDEEHLAEGLRFNLEAEGHSVQLVESGEDALDRLVGEGESYDAVVLDVMLPGKDGFAVARDLRAVNNYVPVLMLTARGRPEDVLKGFESGVDDYLPKPFSLPIFIARVTSLIRRKRWLSTHPPAPAAVPAGDSGEVLRFSGKVIDFEKLQLQAGDQVVNLTVMEADLLRYFARNSDRPLSRKAILENVWNLHEDTDTRAIDNFVVRLRRYIEDDPSKPRHLLTVRGFGYRFIPEPEDKAAKEEQSANSPG